MAVLEADSVAVDDAVERFDVEGVDVGVVVAVETAELAPVVVAVDENEMVGVNLAVAVGEVDKVVLAVDDWLVEPEMLCVVVTVADSVRVTPVVVAVVVWVFEAVTNMDDVCVLEALLVCLTGIEDVAVEVAVVAVAEADEEAVELAVEDALSDADVETVSVSVIVTELDTVVVCVLRSHAEKEPAMKASIMLFITSATAVHWLKLSILI